MNIGWILIALLVNPSQALSVNKFDTLTECQKTADQANYDMKGKGVTYRCIPVGPYVPGIPR